MNLERTIFTTPQPLFFPIEIACRRRGNVRKGNKMKKGARTGVLDLNRSQLMQHREAISD